jgi:adenosylcobinamide-GDP ribazoletransferase
VLASWTGDASPGLLGLSFALLVTAAMRRIVRRRLGGYTGDCLGAVQQVAEVAFLLGMLVVLGATADVGFDEDLGEDEGQ